MKKGTCSIKTVSEKALTVAFKIENYDIHCFKLFKLLVTGKASKQD